MGNKSEINFAVQLGYAAQAMRRKAVRWEKHMATTPHYLITGLESAKVKTQAYRLAYEEFDKAARAAIQTQAGFDSYVAHRDKE